MVIFLFEDLPVDAPGPRGRALPSELQQAVPAVQGRQPQAQEGGEEPGPEVLQGPGHGPGLAAAHAQR